MRGREERGAAIEKESREEKQEDKKQRKRKREAESLAGREAWLVTVVHLGEKKGLKNEREERKNSDTKMLTGTCDTESGHGARGPNSYFKKDEKGV